MSPEGYSLATRSVIGLWLKYLLWTDQWAVSQYPLNSITKFNLRWPFVMSIELL